jgi:hypothetical protein
VAELTSARVASYTTLRDSTCHRRVALSAAVERAADGQQLKRFAQQSDKYRHLTPFACKGFRRRGINLMGEAL